MYNTLLVPQPSELDAQEVAQRGTSANPTSRTWYAEVS